MKNLMAHYLVLNDCKYDLSEGLDLKKNICSLKNKKLQRNLNQKCQMFGGNENGEFRMRLTAHERLHNYMCAEKRFQNMFKPIKYK